MALGNGLLFMLLPEEVRVVQVVVRWAELAGLLRRTGRLAFCRLG